LAGHKVGIAQVFTLDFDEIQSRKKEFIDFIARVHHDKDHFLTLILVTDILKEGSYLLFESDNRKILSLAFDHTIKQADYVEGLVSRKKQVIPKLMKAINILD
jgi:manganese-dependent inorganic pyrophosphatase